MSRQVWTGLLLLSERRVEYWWVASSWTSSSFSISDLLGVKVQLECLRSYQDRKRARDQGIKGSGHKPDVGMDDIVVEDI